MTAHVDAPPLARPSILDRLRERVRRRPPREPVEWVPLHLHETPRVTITTDHGIFRADLHGICLFGNEMVIRFAFTAPEPITIGAVTFAHAGKDHTSYPPDPAPALKAGQRVRVSWGVAIDSVTDGRADFEYES